MVGRRLGSGAACPCRRHARVDARCLRRHALRDDPSGRACLPRPVSNGGWRPGIRHARRRRRRRSGVWLDCGSIRPDPRADAQRHRVLGVYRGVRARAGFPAAPGRPRVSWVRHGRGVGEWRRARVRELGRRASRKGARPDAERMGGWLRGRSPRQRTHPTGLWLARRVLRRNPPGLSHDLDSSARGRTAHLAVAGGRQRAQHPASAACSSDRWRVSRSR